MSTAERAQLKLDLIRAITATEDEQLLSALHHLAASAQRDGDGLSFTDWAAINQGLAQAQRGETVTHQEVTQKAIALIDAHLAAQHGD